MEEINDKIYNILLSYKDELNRTEKELDEIKGKDMVMVVGATGSGKSTLMNAIL